MLDLFHGLTLNLSQSDRGLVCPNIVKIIFFVESIFLSEMKHFSFGAERSGVFAPGMSSATAGIEAPGSADPVADLDQRIVDFWSGNRTPISDVYQELAGVFGGDYERVTRVTNQIEARRAGGASVGNPAR